MDIQEIIVLTIVFAAALYAGKSFFGQFGSKAEPTCKSCDCKKD